MPDQGIYLEDIIEDLSAILQAAQQQADAGTPAVYDALQQSLSGQLQLHILSYIRFLEERDFLVYDRVSDELTPTEAGRAALDAPQDWREAAAEAFAEHLDEDEFGADSDAALEHDFLGQISSELDEMSADVGGGELALDADSIVDAAEPVHEPQTARLSIPAPASTDLHAPTDRPDHSRETMNEATQQHSASPRGAHSTELYQRVSELGVGGVGTVFRATQVKLKRDVALKEVNQVFNVFAGVKRDDIIASFTEVVQRQASLVHPNIVQVLDIETDAEFPFVVTQFAPRGNLRRLIEMPGRPTLTVALKYFMQLLSALSTAHDSGIVHGNIKPENVVLDAAGNAMLSDFGMANVVEREGANTAHVYVGVGTVAYMSPEQFQNPNSATVRSDIYSLGIMLYEMLTGKVPGRRSPMPSSFYPDIPRSLDDIFDKMSVDDPEDRYASVDEILQDLYGSPDCMNLLDNRAGVLFMRDPIEFGEFGGISVPAPDPVASAATTAFDPIAEDDDFGGALDAAHDALEPADEEALAHAPDAQVEADDVLGKLDKYGDIFEEET